jgi:uncharacterized membrane protein
VTAALPSPAHGLSARTHYLWIGLGASIAQALLMLPGYYEDDSFETSDYLAIFGLSLVVSVVVFTLLVPTGGEPTGIGLGLLAVLLSVPFWAMLSLPLAAGAWVIGRRARIDDRERSRGGSVAIALALIAIVATVVAIIVDMNAS